MGPGSLAASLVVHVALVGAGALSVAVSAQGAEGRQRVIEVSFGETAVDLPLAAVRSGEALLPPERSLELPEPGGAHVARPDLARRGRGGTSTSAPALNRSTSSDGVTLERAPVNHLTHSQAVRTFTAERRASTDRRVALTSPGELTLVADGDSSGRFELPGGDLGRVRSLEGRSRAARAPTEADDVGARPERSQESALESRDGHRRGAFERSTRALAGGGRLLSARPWVQRARPSSAAQARGKDADDVESEQRVAERVMSLVQASTAGGTPGPGQGGSPAPGAPGSEGTSGSGSTSVAQGYGAGLGAERSLDPHLQSYYRALVARLSHALRGSFPDWAIREGRSGLVVFEMRLLESGRIAAVRVVRPSGIAEYDRNVVSRIWRVGGFDPLPDALGREAVVKMSWDSLNPVVGREGRGPGGRSETGEPSRTP
jgi:TonB family protein